MTQTNPLILYARPSCCLCHEAEQLLQTLGLAYRLIDISPTPELEAAYGWDIPVLLYEGQVYAQGRITAAQLGSLIKSG